MNVILLNIELFKNSNTTLVGGDLTDHRIAHQLYQHPNCGSLSLWGLELQSVLFANIREPLFSFRLNSHNFVSENEAICISAWVNRARGNLLDNLKITLFAIQCERKGQFSSISSFFRFLLHLICTAHLIRHSYMKQS